jgi:hypothetical protein
LTDELTALACGLCQVRDGAGEDSATVQIVKALQSILAQKRKEGLFQNSEAVTLTPTDLASLLKGKLDWEKLSPKTLASLLYPLGLSSKHTWGDARGRRYHLAEEALNELSARYGDCQEEEKTDDER